MSHPNFTTIRQNYPPNGIYLPANSIIGSVPTHLRQEAWNAQSLPPVPLSDTCGRLCIYIWMKTLRQNRYPPPKSLRLRSLWLVFVVCFIVFISIILNVAHHSLSSEYTKMRCKDTNFLSFKHQNAREFIHIYDSLTLKQAFFRIFGCYGKRPIHPPSWRIDPCCSREVRVNK